MHLHSGYSSNYARVTSVNQLLYLSLGVNEESVASTRPPVATGRQKPEGSSSELTADEDLDLLDLDLDLA
jgi:hypothetical protein